MVIKAFQPAPPMHRLRHASRCLLLCLAIAAAVAVAFWVGVPGSAGITATNAEGATAAGQSLDQDTLDKRCAELQQRFESVIAEAIPSEVEATFFENVVAGMTQEIESTGLPVPSSQEEALRQQIKCTLVWTTWDMVVRTHFGAFIDSLPEASRPAVESVIFKLGLQDMVARVMPTPKEEVSGGKKNPLAEIAVLEGKVRAQLAGILSPELLVSFDRAMADADRVGEVNAALQMLQGLDSNHVLNAAAQQQIATAVGERRAKVWRAFKEADGKSMDFAAEMARADADALQYLHTILPDNEYKIARDLWGPATSASTH